MQRRLAAIMKWKKFKKKWNRFLDVLGQQSRFNPQPSLFAALPNLLLANLDELLTDESSSKF